MYDWFIFAVAWVGIWVVIYAAKPFLRRQMLWVSLFTMFTGLTEPLFVPRYWTPPSLFNLNVTTGFDIESLIFSFAVGGIGSVLYEVALNVKHRDVGTLGFGERRWIHFFSIASMPIVFTLLLIFTNWNPIYPSILSMFVGGVAAVACRPDLAKRSIIGGLLFMALYFSFFVVINLALPSFVDSWNLKALSGVTIFRVPFEEVLYAFCFGMLWSGIYEHIRHYALTHAKPPKTINT